MSQTFDPGDGWREVDSGYPMPEWLLTLSSLDDDVATRYWVRVDPVPPLPTEPATTIRATWRSGEQRDLTLYPEGWCNPFGLYDAEGLTSVITGFEVLAEPLGVLDKNLPEAIERRVRRETAQAVLASAYGDQDTYVRKRRSEVAREFGVES